MTRSVITLVVLGRPVELSYPHYVDSRFGECKISLEDSILPLRDACGSSYSKGKWGRKSTWHLKGRELRRTTPDLSLDSRAETSMGYYIYSVDAGAFEQLTASPTREQALVLADSLLNDFGLEDALEEYGAEGLVDPSKWPLDREALADRIRERLAAADWYADLAYNDATIWDNALYEGLAGEAGEQLRIDFRCENDGLLDWYAAATAARLGALMMDGAKFGQSGFRYSGKSKGAIEIIYSIYLPANTRVLLKQLEPVAPHFETLPDVEAGEREQFFLGLLEPVKRIAEAGRVMWVQTDT